MKRVLSSAALAFVWACSGGSTQLHVALNSNDGAAATTQAALTSAAALDSGGDAGGLDGVQHINVTVNEVDVHLSGDHDADEVNGTEIKDDDKAGWHVVSSTPQSLDLMAIRGNLTQPLGDVVLPTGKFNQIRLKLKTDGASSTTDNGEAEDVIHGAVVTGTGASCDLLVPHSAVDPGVKIVGLYKAEHILANQDATVVVNIRLHDSVRVDGTATCAYRLRPVIEIESFESHDQHEHLDGGEVEHSDGGMH